MNNFSLGFLSYETVTVAVTPLTPKNGDPQEYKKYLRSPT